MSSPRIALYGHDSLGLGHLRRNLALAGTLSTMESRPDLLIVTGTSEAHGYELPPGADLLAIPSIAKGRNGTYGSRRLSVGLDKIVSIRRAVLSAGLEAFAPDVMVVDKIALGFGGELEPALRHMRSRHGTRIVLGLRDVLDAPEAARREWRARDTDTVLRSLFDEVWVYGDPWIYDVIDECGLTAIADMVRFSGYLANGRVGAPSRPPWLPEGTPYALCSVGGGSDGADLALAFADAAMPCGVMGVVVTGPQMSLEMRRQVERLATERSDVMVVSSTPELANWMADAVATVSMGGYNTLSEILATSTPALVVPRESPRAEQVIRAHALARHGIIDTVSSHAIAPDLIGSWLCDAVHRGATDRSMADLDGLSRVREFTEMLLGDRPVSSRVGREVADVLAV